MLRFFVLSPTSPPSLQELMWLVAADRLGVVNATMHGGGGEGKECVTCPFSRCQVNLQCTTPEFLRRVHSFCVGVSSVSVCVRVILEVSQQLVHLGPGDTTAAHTSCRVSLRASAERNVVSQLTDFS